MNPDDGTTYHGPIAPERWFGLLCAGAICTDSDLLCNLETWLNESRQILGEQAVLTNKIRLLLNGASAFDSLEFTIMDISLPSLTRYGAALRLLLEPLSAEKTLNVQAFLSWGTMSDDGFAFQKLFNLHVARRFAQQWHSLSQDSFQCYSPRTSIPALLGALDELERGNGTLKTILVAAASALMKPFGELVKRVL